MLAAIAPCFHESVRRRRMNGPRPDLALCVDTVDGPYSGVAIPGPAYTHVLLSASDKTTRRRYTLAHELGHALLAGVDRQGLNLDRRTEEDMCEAFARNVLMPPAELQRYFSDDGFPQSIAALQRFCRAFRVGIKAAVSALARHHTRDRTVALVVASRRPHSTRSGAVALRVDVASTPRPAFAPYDKRLRSLGLIEMVRWMSDMDKAGVEGSGREQKVQLRSLRAGIAAWTGPADWTAMTMAEPGSSKEDDGPLALVAVLDTSRLIPLPTGRMPRAAASRPAANAVDERQGSLGI